MVKKGRNQTVLSAWDVSQKRVTDFTEDDEDGGN